jgi:hypothetical protein
VRLAILAFIGATAVWAQVAATREIPACSCDRAYYQLPQGMVGLCFRKTPVVSAQSPARTLDTVERTYQLHLTRSLWRWFRNRNDGVVLHGTGAAWGGETPPAWITNKALESHTILWKAGHVVLNDTRGRSADGTMWRNLGHKYESASYFGVPAEAAMKLDAFLDSICIGPVNPMNEWVRNGKL